MGGKGSGGKRLGAGRKRKYPEEYQNPELRRKRKRKHKKQTGAWLRHEYGLTIEAYQAMKSGQGDVCAICRHPFDPLNVDHCHDTGRVRGLLCRGCNIGLGAFKDRPERLAAAISYLRRSMDGG